MGDMAEAWDDAGVEQLAAHWGGYCDPICCPYCWEQDVEDWDLSDFEGEWGEA